MTSEDNCGKTVSITSHGHHDRLPLLNHIGRRLPDHRFRARAVFLTVPVDPLTIARCPSWPGPSFWVHALARVGGRRTVGGLRVWIGRDASFRQYHATLPTEQPIIDRSHR